ncbi:MAG: diguanylate cyclase [Ilumatobacter sp.]
MNADASRTEAWRLAELRGLGLLDTPPEERFDRLTELASMMLDTPIGLLTLVDADRLWLKSRVGLDTPETERDIAFCPHALDADDGTPFVVEDTWLDERFADNPLVVGDPEIRFYAGQVVHSPSGAALGTLCVIDRRPRRFGDNEARILRHLAALVEQEFEREDLAQLASELAASEAFKRSLMSALTEGYVLQDSEGRIVEWNPAAETVLGLTGDELSGRTSMDERWRAVHEDGTPWPGESHPSIEALRTGEPVNDATMGVHRPDGSLVWLRVNSTPIRDEKGAVVSSLSEFADITAEIDGRVRNEQLEADLRLSELTAQVSLEGLDHGVILIDPTGAVQTMNAAAIQMLGCHAPQLTERWRSPAWTTYDADGVEIPPEQRPIEMAMATGLPVTGQVLRWQRPDGDTIIIRVSVMPVDDGSDRMVIGVADMTAERTAIAQFRSAFDDAPIGMAMVGEDAKIIEINAAFARLTGQSPDQLIGIQLTSLCHPDDIDTAEAGWQRLVLEREPVQLEVRFFRTDQTVGRVRVHTSPVGSEHGPAFAIAQVLDTSEQHRELLELAHKADHDDLTGLLNRRAFETALDDHVARCRRYGADGALLMFDLDKFKLINDTLGHSAGDDVIMATADALRRRLRSTDVVCRLGGDEFAVLLPTGDIEHASIVATELLDTMRNMDVVVARSTVMTTASIGVATAPDAVESTARWLARADGAMYRAKRAGGDAYAVFEPADKV